MKKLLFFLLANAIVTNLAFSQGTAINKTGAAADGSAILDLSDTTKGILIPRMKKVNKLSIASPATGLMIYQTDDTTGFWYYNSVKWVQATGPQGITGPTGPTGSGGGGSGTGSYPCYTTPGTTLANPSSGACGFTTTLSLSGNNGNVQWQKSTDGLYFMDIPGAVSTSCNVTVYDSIMYFVAKVDVGSCATSYSNVVMVNASGCPPVSCNTFGWKDHDEAYAIVKTNDGGYVIAGYTNSFGAGNMDIYVVKTDSLGFILWTRTIGGTGSDYGTDIIQTSDSGYAVAGYTYSFGAGNSDMYVVKLGKTGALQWTATIGGSATDEARSIVQTADGGYALGGYTNSYGNGQNFYIVRLDAAGTIQWTTTVGGASNDQAYSMIQTSDGGFALTGDTYSYGYYPGTKEIYIVKLDANGSKVWANTIGGTNSDYSHSIIQTSDGGYAVAGVTTSYGAGNSDVYVVKLFSNGSVDWKKTIGGSDVDEANCIIQTADGGYAVTGYTSSYGTGSDMFVIKLQSNGNPSWARNIGGSNFENGHSLVQTADGGYTVAGITTTYGSGSGDMYIVKLDASGNGCCTSACSPSANTGGYTGSGGSVGSGGSQSSGGIIKTGGTKTTICN